MSLVDFLLSKMTIREKVGQLNLVTAGQIVTGPSGSGNLDENIRAGDIGGIFNLWGREAVAQKQKLAVESTRLGIPLLFALDVLHGHRTNFPIPLAEACAFDVDLWARTARAAAREAAADGIDLTFAPMLDVARDPRWGRIAEGPGEDPLVGAAFARAKVEGFQDGHLAAATSIAATAKHFIGGGAARAGLDYAEVDISERTQREVYLPPFRAAVAAGCAAVMPAFNSVSGVPMTSNQFLLQQVLRSELGFDGVVVSDYCAIEELIAHGIASDRIEAATLALAAGVDMDMASGVYVDSLPDALATGRIRSVDLDAAVLRVLTLKEKLGLFENPYRRMQQPPHEVSSNARLARQAAHKSITLLTNNGTLPLASDARRIAIVGPLAAAAAEMSGPWAGAARSDSAVTVVDGLQAALPSCQLVYHPGVLLDGGSNHGIEAACAACRNADAVVLCIGESAGMSGEAASRAAPVLPGLQRELAEAVLATGIPVVAVLFSGRPLAISWLAEKAGALVAAWFPGDQAGAAIAEILTGAVNPSGRLAVTWPREAGQIPLYYSVASTGRPAAANDPYSSKYLDVPVDPLFHFGHGLSFARTHIENLRADATNVAINDPPLTISVDLVNRSATPTEETLFLFSHDVVASVARPVLELEAWTKALLGPSEKKTVDFRLAPDRLRFLDANFRPVLETGTIELLVGLNADRRSMLSIRIECVARAKHGGK